MYKVGDFVSYPDGDIGIVLEVNRTTGIKYMSIYWFKQDKMVLQTNLNNHKVEILHPIQRKIFI